MKYAIKQKRVRINEDIDFLYPVSNGLVQGDLQPGGEYFETKDQVYTYVTNPILDGKYIITDAYSIEELRKIYNCDEKTYTDDEVINFFFMDQEDKVSIIRDGERVTSSLFDMFEDTLHEKELYQYIDGETSLILNKAICEILLGMDNNEKNEFITTHMDRLANFDERRLNNGIQSILVKDGHVTEITTNIATAPNIAVPKPEALVDADKSGFSMTGLLNYLKERIIGHDKELEKIATILYMNYTSTPKYGTRSILIPGPTGTGKTATFEVASKYFNIPFRDINACNLVPEGIQGTTIEDIFEGLIEECKNDIEKAQKSILVFDEFDKLGKNHLDTKESVVDIFLKLLDGSDFVITRQLKATKVFNTSMASKIGLGAFSEAYTTKPKLMGFGAEAAPDPVFDKKLLVESGYFSKELLDRFRHFIPYKDLTEEDKKRIILYSKLSVYQLEKERLKEQFGIDVIGDDDFVEGVLALLSKEQQSMRDVNNIVSDSFLDAESSICQDKEHIYHTLKLTRDTASKGTFDLS